MYNDRMTHLTPEHRDNMQWHQLEASDPLFAEIRAIAPTATIETKARCDFQITIPFDDNPPHTVARHIYNAIEEADLDTDVIKSTFTSECVFDGDPHDPSSKLTVLKLTYIVDDYFS